MVSVPLFDRFVRLAQARRGAATNKRLLVQVPRNQRRRIVVGASGVAEPGWIVTEAAFVDLLAPAEWSRYFDEASLEAILAEHVWEHLTEEEGTCAAATCYRYLRAGGYVRAAVPDGLHPSSEYRDWVRPGGVGPGADDHQVLYTYRTFAHQFEQAGFSIALLEYFDERGEFHGCDWDERLGMIHRSRRFDERNGDGGLAYTSIVLDASKPAAPRR